MRWLHLAWLVKLRVAARSARIPAESRATFRSEHGDEDLKPSLHTEDVADGPGSFKLPVSAGRGVADLGFAMWVPSEGVVSNSES